MTIVVFKFLQHYYIGGVSGIPIYQFSLPKQFSALQEKLKSACSQIRPCLLRRNSESFIISIIEQMSPSDISATSCQRRIRLLLRWIPKAHSIMMIKAIWDERTFWFDTRKKRNLNYFVFIWKRYSIESKEQKNWSKNFSSEYLMKKARRAFLLGNALRGPREMKSKTSHKLHQWWEFNLTKHMHDAIFINSSNNFQRQISYHLSSSSSLPRAQTFSLDESNFCEKSDFWNSLHDV